MLQGLWGALSLGALLAMVMLGGCGQDARSATAIAIAVKTDLQLEQELRTVKIRVYAADAPIGPTTLLYEAPPQPAQELSRPLVLTPEGRDAVVVAVEGLDARGQALLQTHVRARFAAGQTTAVPVFLARSCLAVACDAAADQTCNGDGALGACGCGPIPSARGQEVTDPADVVGSYRPTGCARACEGDAGTCAPPSTACTPEPAMPGSTCNLTAQCGCPTGQRCVARLQGEHVRAVCEADRGGVLTSGQVCDDLHECAPGYDCIGGNTPTCRRFCESDAECGGAPGSCGMIKVRDDGGVRDAGYKACFQKCTDDSQCQTGCCAGGVCAAPDACDDEGPSCAPQGASCASSADCCAAAPTCQADGAGTRRCTANTPPPPQPAMCAPNTSDSACLACSKRSCCAALSACLNSTACSDFVKCGSACNGNASCMQSCERMHPGGAPLFRSYVSCSNDNCATACEG